MGSRNLNEQLIDAVKKNNIKKVKYILAIGGDANYIGKDEKWPVLYLANSDEVADVLIEKGAKISHEFINKKAKNGESALMVVGSPKVAKMLIDRGEDVNAKDDRGWYALVLAKNDAVADVIIQEGGILFDKSQGAKFRDKYYETALMQANSLKVFRMICDDGGDINTTDYDGYSVLHRAILKQRVEIVRELIGKRVNLEARGKYAETPLISACMVDNEEIVSMLLEKNVNVDAVSKEGRRAIHETKKFSILKKLVEKGADFNVGDNLGNTPLHRAVDSGKMDIFNYLIENKADYNKKNNSGFTVLMKAVVAENEKIIRQMVDFGVDIKERNIYGYDAIKLANKEMRKVIFDACKERELKKEKKLNLRYLIRMFRDSK